jgi:hypothetical protein
MHDGYRPRLVLHSNGILVYGRFQLVGIACLRVAMGDVQQRAPPPDEEEEKKSMDPARFAYISDRTYTAAQVEETTAVVQSSTCDDLRTCPNAKMFLRSFWYRSVQGKVISKEEMHIYTLARCGPNPRSGPTSLKGPSPFMSVMRIYHMGVHDIPAISYPIVMDLGNFALTRHTCIRQLG